MSTQIPKSYLSVQQFLELAIHFEVDSAEYYRLMQKSSTDREVLGLLQDLELRELEHERALREYKQRRKSEAVLQFAPELSLSMPAAPMNPGFAELLEVAVERERQSVRIYRATADLSSGELRRIMEELEAFEQQHLDRLLRIRQIPRQ
jgi:rubrerythrin